MIKELLIMQTLFFGISQAKKYTLDLDLAPEERWLNIIEDKKEEILAFYDQFMNLIALQPDYISRIEEKVKVLDHEYMIEMKSIAKYLGVDIQKVYLVNLITEIGSSCTAISFQPINGKPVLAKNLDVGGNSSSIIDVFIDLEVVKNGKPLFIAPGVAGLVGLANGLKPKSYSITLNNRYDKLTEKMVEAIEKDYTPVMWSLRKCLETCENYESAIKFLTSSNLISGVYYILSGESLYEGISIARNREGVQLETSTPNKEGDWFIVQTNSDLNQEDPDGRRIEGQKKMEILGQEKATLESVEQEILQKVPNFQVNETRASILFDPQNSHYKFTVYRPTHPLHNNQENEKIK